MNPAFAEVTNMPARDPAYRPGRLVHDRLPRVWVPAKLRSVNAGDVNNLLLVLTGVLVVLTGVVTRFARQTVQESQKATAAIRETISESRKSRAQVPAAAQGPAAKRMNAGLG